MLGADGSGTTRAGPVAGGWAVLEVGMNVPVDLAAWVHPRFVHMDSSHCVPNRPL